jgi:hypothetical protein
VSYASNARKLSLLGRVAGKVASTQLRRSRTAQAFWQGMRVTGASFRRVLRQLWLEVTGFVFLVLAAIGGLAGAREYTKFETGKAGPGRLLVAVCFCLAFAYFGVTSFWRVRRKT